MLFNEPKLLKSRTFERPPGAAGGFSALQRAEIAEIPILRARHINDAGFSALQRAEIAEIRVSRATGAAEPASFSALQRAEIAEI